MKDLDVILALALAAHEHHSDVDVIQQVKQLNPRVTPAQRRDILVPIMNSRAPVQAVWQKAESFLPVTPHHLEQVTA